MPDALTRLRALLDAASLGKLRVEAYFDGQGVTYTNHTLSDAEGSILGAVCDGYGTYDGVVDSEEIARAIAAWMNLRGPVLALVEAVRAFGENAEKRYDLGLEAEVHDAYDALRAAVEKEVPDA